QRIGACFDRVSVGPCAPVQARIQASRILSIGRHVRSLYGATHHMECPARMDHACASSVARRNRARLRLAPCRSSFVYRPTFSGLLSTPIPGAVVGSHRKLAAGDSGIQGSVPDVVWAACVSFLFASFFKQGCRSKLGRASPPRLWTPGNLLLVGACRVECALTPHCGYRDTGRVDHEHGGTRYRLAAHGWI